MDGEWHRADESPSPSVVAFAIRLVISIGLLIGLIQFTGIDLARDSYAVVPVVNLVVALVLSVAGTVIVPAILTHVALRRDRISLSLAYLVSLNLAMRFYVIVLPRAASIAIRWYRYGLLARASDSLALMLFERVVQLFVFILAATVLLVIEHALGNVRAPLLLAVAIGATALLAIGGSAFFSSRVLAFMQALSRPMKQLLGRRLSNALAKLREAIAAFQELSRPERWKITGLALISYVLFVLSASVVAAGMNLDAGPVALGWIRPIVFLLTLVPISVGGVGVREGAFVALLSVYGIGSSMALEFALVLFGIQLTIALAGAVVEATRMIGRRMVREHQR